MKYVLTPGEKALSLAYVHHELLKKNLMVLIHELKVKNDKRYKPLQDRLDKLRTAGFHAFRELNTIMKDKDQREQMVAQIESMMDDTWSEAEN